MLYTFTDETEGWQPDAAPILDTAGNLYGTTQYGGTEGGFGTVFELDTKGNERVLYSFAGEPDGEDPVTGLVGDHSGNLYGTTLYGGTAGGFGTVFKLAHTGKLTLLHSFGSDPDGADPAGSLIGDPQGNGYGTTQYGGAAGGYGTVFELDANGQLNRALQFCRNSGRRKSGSEFDPRQRRESLRHYRLRRDGRRLWNGFQTRQNWQAHSAPQFRRDAGRRKSLCGIGRETRPGTAMARLSTAAPPAATARFSKSTERASSACPQLCRNAGRGKPSGWFGGRSRWEYLWDDLLWWDVWIWNGLRDRYDRQTHGAAQLRRLIGWSESPGRFDTGCSRQSLRHHQRWRGPQLRVFWVRRRV